MTQHTLKISSPRARALARAWIDRAPEGSIIRLITDPTRTTEQNAKLWAMLGDISKQSEHNGRKYTPETWKMLMMHSLGHETRFEIGLNGEPFPVGFRSSNLGVKEMAELIEWIYKWGAENSVKWSERGYDAPERG